MGALVPHEGDEGGEDDDDGGGGGEEGGQLEAEGFAGAGAGENEDVAA